MKKVLNVLICLVIFIIGYFCFFKYIMKVDYVSFGPYKFLAISSESMRPEILKGDAVIINEKKGFEKGDLVSFTLSGSENIRQITRIDGNQITVKETYLGNEQTIEAHRITGTVIQILPKIGNVFFQLTEPWTFVMVSIFVLSYFAFVYNKRV
ncbi:MAG: S24 family peptidase [Bacilli bacterium]|nr:S24 family peptidase [Bacilli bacterium]